MKMDRELWTVIFNGLSSIATAAVAILALWAAFFTDIPDALIRQLRADASEAREQIIDLRRDRRTLEAQVVEAQKRLTTLNSQTGETEARQNATEQKLKLTLENLEAAQGSLAVAHKELAAVKQERLTYFREVGRSVVDGFVSAVDDRLKEYEYNSQLAQQFPQYRAWRAREAKRREQIASLQKKGNIEEAIKLIGSNDDPVPQAWSRVEFRDRFRDLDDRRTTAEFLADYEKEISSRFGVPSVVGEMMLREELKKARVDLLVEQDRLAMLERFDAFLSEHKTAIYRPIVVSLPVGWSDDEIVSKGKEVQQNIGAIRDIIPLLRAVVLAGAR